MARVKKSKVVEETPRFTEKRVPLKDTTAFFEFDKYQEAKDFARRKRSYTGLAINENKEIIGHYVPA